jgi:hypothetical protein
MDLESCFCVSAMGLFIAPGRRDCTGPVRPL